MENGSLLIEIMLDIVFNQDVVRTCKYTNVL